MKYQLLPLAILVACASLYGQNPTTSSSADHAVFSDGLRKGWEISTWGKVALKVQKDPQLDRNVLALICNDQSKSWSGGLISTSAPPTGAPAEIPLPDDKKNGFLVFSVNGGNDEWGNHIGGQLIQISIGHRNATGQWDKGSSFVPINKYIAGNSIDGDPSTWQEVRIPLSTLTASQNIPAIGAVFVQYIGTPVAPLAISSIKIEP